MLLLINLAFVATFIASAVGAEAIQSCDRVCEAMRTLNPDGDVAMYSELSYELSQVSNVIDPMVAVAIAYQESGIRFAVSKNFHDYGIFQFHHATVKMRKLDTLLLISNVEYNVKHFALIMRKKREQCIDQYPGTWYACWHSASPQQHKIYADQIRKHLTKIGAVNERFYTKEAFAPFLP